MTGDGYPVDVIDASMNAHWTRKLDDIGRKRATAVLIGSSNQHALSRGRPTILRIVNRSNVCVESSL
jgi:hypothetical protein